MKFKKSKKVLKEYLHYGNKLFATGLRLTVINI